MMPCAGSRPVSRSQNSRFVFTPLPSGDGQVTSAGATVVRFTGTAGLRVEGLAVWAVNVAAASAMAHENATALDMVPVYRRSPLPLRSPSPLSRTQKKYKEEISSSFEDFEKKSSVSSLSCEECLGDLCGEG